MSTILKSLKKLEKEKESQNTQVPAPALISGSGTHQAIHGAVQFAWIKGRIIKWSVIGAVSVAVLAAVLYAFSRSGDRFDPRKPPRIAMAPKETVPPAQKIAPYPHPVQPIQPTPKDTPAPAAHAVESKPVASPQPEPAAAPPAVAVPRPTADAANPSATGVDPPVAPPPLPKDGFEALGQKPAPSTMGAVPVQERQPQEKEAKQQSAMIPRPRPVAGPKAPLPGTIAPVAPPVAAAPMEPVPAPAKAPVESPAAAAAPEHKSVQTPATQRPEGQPQSQKQRQAAPAQSEEAAYAGAERMTGGALKVQAIVFAPSADERMAVVNNTIVREGSAIESYTIVGIGEEAVYVREGQGRLLKVPFGKP